jgi:DNA topoisomerase-1
MDHKIYLSDKGIYKKGNKYYYNKNNECVLDSETILRLSKIRAPPAWTSVWYSSSPRCHIQCHGIDASGKKQYILSEKWINTSRSEKFNRMKSFVRKIQDFKKIINLKYKKLTKETLIHLLFNLLIDTHIRVGNEIYAERNSSYGLTTLRQKHLKNENGIFKLVFLGKSKIKHTINVPVFYNFYFEKLKVNIPNKPLFYYDKFQTVSSEDLNNYLKEKMGKEYTCKDFRTYSANILFIKALKKNSSNQISKKTILKCIDISAKELGHTRNICRKSYISNTLLDYCLDNPGCCSLTEPELLSKVWS